MMKTFVFLFFGLALLFGFLQYKRYQKIFRIKTEMADYVYMHSGGKYYFSWKDGSIPAQYIFPKYLKESKEDDNTQILNFVCSPYIKERYASLMDELLSEWDYVGLMLLSTFFGIFMQIIRIIIKRHKYENKGHCKSEHNIHAHAHV